MERRFAAQLRQALELASRIDPGSHTAKVQRILGLVHSHRGDFAAPSQVHDRISASEP
jgi:hypothetical protein